MNAEIVAVGTELLLGNILNTNAQYLSCALSELGIDVYYQSVVGDNPARLASAVELSLSRADMVVITGGLGPTQDDLTKETVAQFMEKKLILHQPSLDKMKEYFAAIGREMTPNNEKQAMLPENAVVLPNDCGTAPGCILEKDGKTAILLPGPPVEMETMYQNYVRPYLAERADSTIRSRTLRLFGIGESKAESMIQDLMEQSQNPTVAPYAKLCEVHLRLTAKAEDQKRAEEMLDTLEGQVREILGEYVYGYDGDDLQTVACRLLREKGLTVSFAESCTGGLLAKMLTDVAGSSDVFGYGFVTYANRAKTELVNVPPELLRRFGAVSEPVAVAMSRGARRAAASDVALSVTGIAGPGGGSEEKPVGLVYIGLSTPDGTICKRFQFSGSRDKIRTQTAMNALSMLVRYLSR